MHICRHRHRPLIKPICINKNPIPTKKTLTILGIILDRTLSFRNHFIELRNKCKTRVNLLKTISCNRTRSDRSLRLKVAKAVINSKIFYGLEITSMASTELIKQMGPIYNGTIRTISGLLPSTPALAACVEAGVLPLDFCTANAAASRAIAFLEKTIEDGSVAFTAREANRILSDVAGIKIPRVAGVHWCGSSSWQLTPPKIDAYVKQNFRAGSEKPRVRALFAERLHDKYSNHTVKFTDGSKTDDKVGIGIYSKSSSECHRLKQSCSIFSAEAAAIYQAVVKPTDGPLLVVSDSASVISALASHQPKHPWIQAILLETADPTSDITVTWVPGHCGIPGNEAADRLANEGRNSRILTSKTPGRDAKIWIKNCIYAAWAKKWLEDRNLFIGKIKRVPHAWIDRTSRREQVVLSRLRTGHTRLSHNMEDASDFRRRCTTCRAPNTVEHFVTECPIYEHTRKIHDIGCISAALQNDSDSEAALINFLRDAEIYDDI